MPQLDQFTYLSQYVWLCVFYMTFYVLLYNYGLPKISRILKLRAYLVSQQSKDTQLSNKNVDTSVVLQTALKNSFSYLYSSVSGASNWCSGMINSLNSNQLKPMNKSYLSSLGEIGLSQVIKDSALNASAPVSFSIAPKGLEEGLNQIYVLRLQRSLLSNIKPKKKKK
jgi:hypothetical protein